MRSIAILGTHIEEATESLLVQEIAGYLRAGHPHTIAKVNAEFLVRSLSDPSFQTYLNSTDLNIADGTGVLWAARFLTLRATGVPVLKQLQILWQALYSLSSLLLYPKYCRYPIPERIPGVEALYLMLEAAQEAEASVYFLGAGETVNVKARERIQARYPGLRIAGGRDGYWTDDREVLEAIDGSGARLLVVALGSPKQEFWIRDHGARLKSVRVAVGEGGSLDFIAGDFRRAPDWMQRIGLEWLWRLFMNKSKTKTGSRARRVWNAVPVFISCVVAWKLRHGAARLDEQPG
jgi:N-acetylglucosaminyldiphosphoundecaprenol N-acetyl-beta-D-mannosaminyltransferase